MKIKRMSKLCFALLGSMIGTTLLILLINQIVKMLPLYIDGALMRFVLLGCSSIGYFVLFWLFSHIVDKKPIQEISMGKAFSIVEGIKYFVFLMGFSPVISLLSRGLMIVFARIIGQKEANAGLVEELVNAAPPGVIIICVAVIAPLMEELLFRKVLLERLLPYGKAPAILISSIMFGVFHANFEQMFYTILLAVVCSNIVIQTGKVRNAVYIHMAYNMWGSVVAPQTLKSIPEVIAVIQIVFTIAAVIIFVKCRKSMFVSMKEKEETFEWKRELCSVGSVAYLLFFIGMGIEALMK